MREETSDKSTLAIFNFKSPGLLSDLTAVELKLKT